MFVSPAAVEHGLATLQTQVSGKPVVAWGPAPLTPWLITASNAAPQSGMRSEDLLSIDTVELANVFAGSHSKGEGGRIICPTL